ncbi:MAG TPA: hypothetical protein VIO61_01535 [Anaerolineaceae bacterium]
MNCIPNLQVAADAQGIGKLWQQLFDIRKSLQIREFIQQVRQQINRHEPTADALLRFEQLPAAG